VTATEWRDSLTSGQVVALFGYDPSVNWAAVRHREVTAAPVKYARIGLDGVVPPCLESPRTRAKRFHAALQRVLRATGRPVHVWEYRCYECGHRPGLVRTVLVVKCQAVIRRVLAQLGVSPCHCALRPVAGSRAAWPLPVRLPAPSDGPWRVFKEYRPPPPRRF